MNIKSVALTVGIIISVVTISVLISNYISERNLRSVDLPAVSYEREKEQQPRRVLKSITDRAVPKVQYQPVSKGSREVEVEYSEESVPEISYDDALRDVELRDKGTGLEDREAGIMIEGGPPSQRAVRPLPIFEPITNETGPIPEDSDITQSKLPEISEQYDYDDASVTVDTKPKPLPSLTPVANGELPETTEQQYSFGGPLAPHGLETKPLPSFTPITNKTGPVATNKNRY